MRKETREQRLILSLSKSNENTIAEINKALASYRVTCTVEQNGEWIQIYATLTEREQVRYNGIAIGIWYAMTYIKQV